MSDTVMETNATRLILCPQCVFFEPNPKPFFGSGEENKSGLCHRYPRRAYPVGPASYPCSAAMKGDRDGR
jgi:hypothetical protein